MLAAALESHFSNLIVLYSHRKREEKRKKRKEGTGRDGSSLRTSADNRE